MGIFNNLKVTVESELLELYVYYFVSTGVSKSEARKMVSEMILSSKKDAQKEETDKLPSDFGDLLLKKEKTDLDVKKTLRLKRLDGVTDDDIKKWWNLEDLERRMALKYDEIMRFTMFNYYIENPPRIGMSQGEIDEYASNITRKYNAKYGSVEFGNDSSDRDLPCELKDRVNIYIQRRMEDPVKYKKDIEMYTSFNALVRKEIKKGNL